MADGGRSKVTIVLASLAIVLAGWLVLRTITSDPPLDSVEYLSTELTIRCAETGDEWTMSRAKLERELYTRPGVLDPNQGLVNANIGKPTGFPSNRERDWDSVIERINAQKTRLQESRDK